MGTVYRARDEHSGHLVALKLLRTPNDDDERYLVREAQTLAALPHPGIVARVAHGSTDRGEPYLAMEWLEGVSLAERLKQGRLGLDATLVLLRALADTLAWAHERGLVHRDLKPGNIMLVGGDTARPTILDFGLARVGALGTLPSGAPRIAGTPGYMAPEQARGDDDLDARADVFALGVIGYRCLAGVPPFRGRDAVAILAKSIFEEPTPLVDVAPQVPAGLAALVTRMLSKDRTERPKDAGAVLAALDGLLQRRAAAAREPRELGRRERRLLAIIVCELPPASGPTPLATWAANVGALRAAAAPWDARFELVGNGAAVALLRGTGTATELAIDAARCALGMQAAIVDAAIAVACAHGDAAAPMGDLLERATVLLRHETGRRGSIVLDATTHALLPRRFSRAIEGASVTLQAEAGDDEGSGTLLGRATPFVGRDPERARLVAAVEHAFRTPASAGVLLVGEAGVGTTRLAVESLREVQRRVPQVLVWRARGEALRTGSPFALISQLLRSALGASSEPSQYTLEAFCQRTLHGDPEASAFLAELMGLAPEDEVVRSARRDASVMGDRLRLVWLDLVAATCAMRPLVLLVEDLHFADEASVTFLGAALRRGRSTPLFVLGTARPEGRARLSSRVDAPAMSTWPVGELPTDAAVELVTSVLGAVEPGELGALVERAGGNVLYLEELLRAKREGHASESLLGLVRARILTFPDEARRVLRAASIFGERFTTREVAALLGDEGDELAAKGLRELEPREAVRPLGEGRYGFRHGLVRDAAYAMLTDEERVMGHRLAAQFLEPRGDPALVAEHYERAGDRAEAVAKHDQAATVALARSDCEGALRHVRRAIEAGAHGGELSHLQGLAAEAHNGRGAHTEAALASLAAMAGLPEGSAEFYQALTEHLVASARTGNVDRVLETARRVLALPAVAETAGLRAVALARAASSLIEGKHRSEGLRLVDEVDALLASHPQDDQLVVARVHELHGHRAMSLGDVGQHRAFLEAAADAHELLGSERNAATCRVHAALSACKLGEWERAESLLRSALLAAERLGLPLVEMAALNNLGLALMGQARIDEAIAVERRAVEVGVQAADARIEGGARAYLAMLLLRAGQPEAAADEAGRAGDALSIDPATQALARAVHARAKLALGDAEGALELARRAMEVLRADGALTEGESLIRLAYAEALDATGDAVAGRLALTIAAEKLLRRAGQIDDEELRRSFLERVPEHAETLARLRRAAP